MNRAERYAVYHANDLHEMVAPQAAHWFTDRSGHYTHVADVEAPLGQVFALTNHIDHSWTSNPQVVWHTTARVRSTSVGDVIVSVESGRAWLVMPIGLRELGVDNEPGTEEGREKDTRQPPTEGKEGRP